MNRRPRRHSRAATKRIAIGVLAASLLPFAETKGQEALRSAISLDQAVARENNPANAQPDLMRFGPARLSFGAYSGATYDDNINTSQADPKSDVLLRTGINLGMDWPISDNSELRFDTGIGYLHYFQNTWEDGLEITPDSALAYSASLQDVTVTLFDQFYYSREVISQGAVANLTSLPRLENTIGVRGSWNPNQWILECGYSHDDFISEKSSLDYLNRSSEYLFGRAGWRFAEQTQAGIEVSASFSDYAATIQNDNRSVSIGGYAQWQVRPWLRLDLRGGPTFYTFESRGAASGSTLNSYYVSLAAEHQLTDFITHTLALERNVQLGPNRGANYVEQLTARYSLTWNLTKRVNLSAWISYEKGNQPLPFFFPGGLVISAMENFDRYGGGMQATWRMTDKLVASVGFNHWLRESNFHDRRYTENSVSLSFSYTL